MFRFGEGSFGLRSAKARVWSLQDLPAQALLHKPGDVKLTVQRQRGVQRVAQRRACGQRRQPAVLGFSQGLDLRLPRRSADQHMAGLARRCGEFNRLILRV